MSDQVPEPQGLAEVDSTGDPPAPPPDARPKTAQVVALLVGVAGIFSYLMSYCMVNALVAAEVVARPTPGSDPRPRILVLSFALLTGALLGVAALARASSRRQLSIIDAMEKD